MTGNPSTAADVMTDAVITVNENLPFPDLVYRMLDDGVSNVPVVRVENGRRLLVGFVSELDCIQALGNQAVYERPNTPVRELARIHPMAVRPDTALATLASIFLQHGYRHLPVVCDGALLGIVSRRDVLRGLIGRYQEQLTLPPGERTAPRFEDAQQSPYLVG